MARSTFTVAELAYEADRRFMEHVRSVLCNRPSSGGYAFDVGKAHRWAGISDRLRSIEQSARLRPPPTLLEALEGLKPILDRAESNASGNPEWDAVSARVNAARAAIALARGDADV